MVTVLFDDPQYLLKGNGLSEQGNPWPLPLGGQLRHPQHGQSSFSWRVVQAVEGESGEQDASPVPCTPSAYTAKKVSNPSMNKIHVI